MKRTTLYVVLLAACICMRPVSAFQQTAPTVRPDVDRALMEQFAAAADPDRVALVTAHADILQKPFLEALSDLGEKYRNRGELATAEKYYSSVLWVGRTYKMPLYEAIGMNNMGINAGAGGNHAAAKDWLLQAVEVATANNDIETIHSTWTNLGILRRKAGDLDGALEYQMRGLAIARELNRPELVGRNLNNIGVVLQNQGNNARALDYYIESLSLKESGSATVVDVINTNVNIGGVYAEQGDHALAIEYYRRAIDLVEKQNGDIAISSPYNNMGQALAATGDYPLARVYLNKALQLAEKVGDPDRIATPLYVLGNVARAEGKLDEAEALQRRALGFRRQAGDAIGYIESLTELSNLFDRRGRTAEGLPFGLEAVAIASQTRLLNQLWKAQLTVGHAQAKLGQTTEARANFQGAIDTIETLRLLAAGGSRSKQQYLSDRMGPYYGLAELDAKAGRGFESLAVVDHARARALIDTLAGVHQPMRQLTQAQRDEERKLTEELIASSNQVDQEMRKSKSDAARVTVLEEKLRQARIARDAFVGQLYTAQPDLGFARGNTPEITRDRLNAVLTPGMAIVTFMLESDSAWRYVVTPNSSGPVVTATKLTMSTSELTALAETFSQQISTRNLAFSANAHKLYDTLFGSADATINSATHVVLVPDGPLWQVPFQALQTPRGRFMIEERALSYTPSIAALSALEARRKSRAVSAPFLVALGDPETGVTNPGMAANVRGGALTRLPEAAREVKSLGQLYGATKSSVFVASDAKESVLREQVSRASIIHIATHGVLDNSNPMYSHLLLTPGDTSGKLDPGDHLSDGRLEAWEMLDMGITADLAVLSACQTARGGNGWGEGVIGLSWSLFASGASTAVVSQWEVDSASTTSLMIAFHRRLLNAATRTKGAPEALRQAAVTLMKNPAYRHPFYWAGFVSVGAK